MDIFGDGGSLLDGNDLKIDLGYHTVINHTYTSASVNRNYFYYSHVIAAKYLHLSRCTYLAWRKISECYFRVC